MAEEEKKKFPMLMVVAIIVIGLILASGVSYYIASKVITGDHAGAVAREPGVFIRLGDQKDGIIVNVGGVKSGRFVKIGINLEMDPANEASIKEGKLVPAAEAKVMDTVLQVLRSRKIEEFDPDKQENLKVLIKEELNKAVGENSVYEVYITNFVLQ